MIHTNAKDLRTSSLLDVYLHEIKADALLTAAEEGALASNIAQGDAEARNRMVCANLRLVVKIARDYLGRGLSLDDLIGEGNIGLIRASEEYDPAFGTRFSTYASYWIKQAIRHALTNTTAVIRLPAHMVGLLAKWRRTERALTKELGREPSEEQIAVQLGLTDAQLDMVRRAKQAGRLQLESGMPGDDGWSPDDSPDGGEAPDSQLESSEERLSLYGRLSRLDDRERTIVSLRYGLDGGDPMTLKEVGRRLGVTREWVRKIEIRAVRKLDDNPTSDVGPPPSPIRSAKRSAAVSNRRRGSRPRVSTAI